VATATHNNLTFNGTLTVSVKEAKLAEGFFDRPVTRQPNGGGFSVYSKDKTAKGGAEYEELWLFPPRIVFTGAVTVHGAPAQMRQWVVGIIQTITSSNRIAHYGGGKTRHLRLDTTSGALRDGSESSIFYTSAEKFSLVGFANPNHKATVSDDDTPNFKLPTSYSGDPSSPHNALMQSPLLRTEGTDIFKTYLAVVNETTKTIITLGDCDWEVSWNGNYDAEKKQWRPTADDFHRFTPHDRAAVYPDLVANKATAQVPFSLFLDSAETACQILTNQGWTPCGMNGDPTKGQNQTVRRWND